MSDNTYGSYGLRVGRLCDLKGKYIKEDTLFLHIDDYWTNFYNPNKIYFLWHTSTMSKLERHIRRKWPRGKLNKFLPHVDILFDLIKTKDEGIDPTKILDSEKYFESLILWKKKYEYWYLRERPMFKRHRHKKILWTTKPLRW